LNTTNQKSYNLMIIKFYNKFMNFYDSKIAFSKLGDIFSLIYYFDKLKADNIKFTEFINEGVDQDINFLISTQKKGLLLYNRGEIIQLFKKKGFYGLTKHKKNYYAFHITGFHGNIISFALKDKKAIKPYVVIRGLSKGIHQIDFIDDDLYVTNTYDNSILIYNKIYNKKNIHWKNYDNIIYPNGKLSNGRFSSNYNHFNSIFRYKKFIYLFAHNETMKSSRNSEIYKLDKNNFNIIEIKKTAGSNGHNIYIDENQILFCKSIEGTLASEKKDILKHKNIFTRGLSVSNKYLILGGSEIAHNRNDRGSSSGYVYIYNLNFKLLQKICIDKTQIQEVRQINIEEKTLSNSKYNI
tara:strand:+ start:836 stop:1894 length:1059 start_codon:yes stop_codon:yes gene_type:complete